MPHKSSGAPSIAHFAMGGIARTPPVTIRLPWPVLSFNINQPCSTNKTVISTEAAHGIIVSSAVEKSASPPPPFPNPHRYLAFQRDRQAKRPPLSQMAKQTPAATESQIPHPTAVTVTLIFF